MDKENSQQKTLAKIGIIAGVSFVLGLSFDYLFYGKVPGISFFLYVLLIVVGLFIITIFYDEQINRRTLWLLLPLFFFSAMIFVRSSFLLSFLNVVASLLLLLLITEVSFGDKLRNFLIGDYLKIFFIPFKFIRSLSNKLSELFSLGKVNKDQKVFTSVVKGILISLPVIFIFLLLFSSADLIFQKYISSLINFDFESETIIRSMIVLISSIIFMGAYSYTFRENKNQIDKEENDDHKSIGHIESSILLGSVNLLFFIFIIIQLTYLFGGESAISLQGFTYAEYARRGFFELIAVAIISLLLLIVTERNLARKDTIHRLGFKIMSTVLTLEVILIMASAFTRLSLYEEAYGFTILRLYSHAFIILLAVIFFIFLYKIYKDKRESAFAFRVFISIILFLTIMNLLNPDVFIARRNIERYASTGKLDVDYLSSLSSDAIPETIKILDISDEELKKQFANGVYWLYHDINSEYLTKWQSFNISRTRAKIILDSKIQVIESYKDI